MRHVFIIQLEKVRVNSVFQTMPQAVGGMPARSEGRFAHHFNLKTKPQRRADRVVLKRLLQTDNNLLYDSV